MKNALLSEMKNKKSRKYCREGSSYRLKYFFFVSQIFLRNIILLQIIGTICKYIFIIYIL